MQLQLQQQQQTSNSTHFEHETEVSINSAQLWLSHLINYVSASETVVRHASAKLTCCCNTTTTSIYEIHVGVVVCAAPTFAFAVISVCRCLCICICICFVALFFACCTICIDNLQQIVANKLFALIKSTLFHLLHVGERATVGCDEGSSVTEG